MKFSFSLRFSYTVEALDLTKKICPLKTLCSVVDAVCFRFTMQTSFLEITFLTASVTRLDCRINGNFSIKRIGQKYIDSEFVNHNQKSFKECAVLCTTTDQCHFFNLNSRTSLCQIYLTSDYGFLEEKLVNDSDWIFGATDFSRKLVRS